MFVPSEILRQKLFSIFAAQAGRGGGSLSFGAIQRSWLNAGLRLMDLRDAIREMTEDGVLTYTHKGSLMLFWLTSPDGDNRFQLPFRTASLKSVPVSINEGEYGRGYASSRYPRSAA